MSNKGKVSQYFSKQNLNASQQSLPTEWQVHNNRLNFLQHIVTRMQKKIIKLEANIYIINQTSNSYKEEFRQKLNEMLTTVSLPQNQVQSNSQEIDHLNHQINELKISLSKNQTRYKKFHQQINHLTEKSTFKFDQNQLKYYLNDKIASVEQKNKIFVSQKLYQVNKIIQNIQQSIVQNSKKQQKELLNRNNQQSNFLNTSEFSETSSQNFLSKSRSQSNLVNSRSSNVVDNCGPDREKNLTKRLNFTEQERKMEPKQHAVSGLSGLSPRKDPSKSTQLSVIPPTSQNNSRVVYLRQKLRQFEQINKKYQKKQVQYQVRKKQPASHSQKNRQTKNTSYLGKFQGQSNKPQCEEDNQSKNNKKQSQKINQSLTSRRQDSVNKRFLTSSQNKHNLLSQNSSKKIDQLKSIKDYLQQTQSQIQDSFFQPNYMNLKS